VVVEESEVSTVKNLLEKYHSYLQESISTCKSACETISSRVVELQEAQDSAKATITSIEEMAESMAMMQQVQETTEWQQEVAQYEKKKEMRAARDAQQREQQMQDKMQESPRFLINLQAASSTSPKVNTNSPKNTSRRGANENSEDEEGTSPRAALHLDAEDDEDDEDEDDTAGMVWNATLRAYVKRHGTDTDSWRHS
jgi:hypothetical protein